MALGWGDHVLDRTVQTGLSVQHTIRLRSRLDRSPLSSSSTAKNPQVGFIVLDSARWTTPTWG